MWERVNTCGKTFLCNFVAKKERVVVIPNKMEGMSVVVGRMAFNAGFNPPAEIDTVIVSEGVEVQPGAFARAKVKHVIWNTSASIPYGCFIDSSVESITFPKGKVPIGSRAFEGTKFASISKTA